MYQTIIMIAVAISILIAVWQLWLRKLWALIRKDLTTMNEMYIPGPLVKSTMENNALSEKVSQEVDDEIHKHFVPINRAGVRDERPTEGK